MGYQVCVLALVVVDGDYIEDVSSLFKYLWQNAPAGIEEPVNNLQVGQPGLLRQQTLLSFRWVRIQAVLEQPVSEDLAGHPWPVPFPLLGF